jgi:hypothetical protein
VGAWEAMKPSSAATTHVLLSTPRTSDCACKLLTSWTWLSSACKIFSNIDFSPCLRMYHFERQRGLQWCCLHFCHVLLIVYCMVRAAMATFALHCWVHGYLAWEDGRATLQLSYLALFLGHPSNCLPLNLLQTTLSSRKVFQEPAVDMP